MKNRTLALPLIVVAAVVALVLGSFGSATAAGLTAHTVKRIAGKVVDKKASSLSVAHAVSANTANTANTATNATNLNGQPASAYQSRAAFSGTTNTVALPANTQVQVASVTLTVPAGVSFAHVTAVGTVDGPANTFFGTWVSEDLPCTTLSGPGFAVNSFSLISATRTIGAYSAVLAVTPGTHTFNMCHAASQASTSERRTLTVETTNLNGAGGTARPAGGAGGGSATGAP